jgi:hypothetical protein
VSDQANEGDSVPIIRRADVIAHIEARLAGRITDAALASWSFDRFYAEELGEETYEDGVEAVLADVLDVLMFGDDPGFRLDADELHALVTRLQSS